MPGRISKPISSIGVLTGGGDVPGLNVAIKALVYRAENMGIRVMGLRAGWEGITYLDRARGLDALIFRDEDPATWKSSYLMPLERLNTRNIDRQGGTILQSSRTNPANTRVSDLPSNLQAYAEGRRLDERVDLTQEVLANLEFLELDGILCGQSLRRWITMYPGPITALASRQPLAVQPSSLIASALLWVRIARLYFSAYLAVMPVLLRLKRQQLPGQIA